MKIVQITDTHEDVKGITNAINAIKSVKDYDLLLFTGDACFQNFYQGFDVFKNMIPAYAGIMGNHDMIADRQHNYDYIQVSQHEAYLRYFANNQKHVKVNMKPDTLYWYKDLPDCRVIGLDYTARGDVYYNEWYWLDSLLKETAENNIPVFIASHEICGTRKIQEGSDFTNPTKVNYMKYDQQYNAAVFPFMAKSYELVTKYADNYNLKVLAWIHGHEHYDMVLTSENKNKFPMIVMASTYHDTWNDVCRTNSNDWKSDAVINVYEWYKSTNSLLITRIGERSCYSGCLRDFISYSYDRGIFASAEARGM